MLSKPKSPYLPFGRPAESALVRQGHPLGQAIQPRRPGIHLRGRPRDAHHGRADRHLHCSRARFWPTFSMSHRPGRPRSRFMAAMDNGWEAAVIPDQRGAGYSSVAKEGKPARDTSASLVNASADVIVLRHPECGAAAPWPLKFLPEAGHQRWRSACGAPHLSPLLDAFTSREGLGVVSTT